MEVRGRSGVIMLSLVFIFALAYVAKAGLGGDPDRQTAQGANGAVFSGSRNLRVIPVVSWSEPGEAISPSHNGSARVDRDFGAFHKDDTNQFGDDRSYNSSEGRTNRESDYQAHHWIPETYGLMGDYGYDSR
jgi:hypothetical protein